MEKKKNFLRFFFTFGKVLVVAYAIKEGDYHEGYATTHRHKKLVVLV